MARPGLAEPWPGSDPGRAACGRPRPPGATPSPGVRPRQDFAPPIPSRDGGTPALESQERAVRFRPVDDAPTIGILALQGNFREHAATLRRLGARVREVRKPEQLEGLHGL